MMRAVPLDDASMTQGRGSALTVNKPFTLAVTDAPRLRSWRAGMTLISNTLCRRALSVWLVCNVSYPQMGISDSEASVLRMTGETHESHTDSRGLTPGVRVFEVRWFARRSP